MYLVFLMLQQIVVYDNAKGKDKVIPLQARCDPEGGKRCSSTLP